MLVTASGVIDVQVATVREWLRCNFVGHERPKSAQCPGEQLHVAGAMQTDNLSSGTYLNLMRQVGWKSEIRDVLRRRRVVDAAGPAGFREILTTGQHRLQFLDRGNSPGGETLGLLGERRSRRLRLRVAGAVPKSTCSVGSNRGATGYDIIAVKELSGAGGIIRCACRPREKQQHPWAGRCQCPR